MYWLYGNRMAKNPNILHLHMLIRQILSSKIRIFGQNPNLWQRCIIGRADAHSSHGVVSGCRVTLTHLIPGALVLKLISGDVS